MTNNDEISQISYEDVRVLAAKERRRLHLVWLEEATLA